MRFTEAKFLLLLVFSLIFAQRALALSEADLFPFDQRHLVYPTFQKDLDSISAFISSVCINDPSKLAAEIKNDYLQTCSFPKLMAALKDETSKANKLFSDRDLVTREKAQFIDIEFGWVYHDLTVSLGADDHIPLLNVILLKNAIQASMLSAEKMWLIQGGRESLAGRFYILPKFAAGVERDLILTRTLYYAKTILCMDQKFDVEVECLQRRSALVRGIDNFLAEFQAKEIVIPMEIDDYARLSQNFRLKLASWLGQHSTPLEILKAIQTPDADYADLANTYAALIDLPKRIHASDINALAGRLNVQRYVREQKAVEQVATTAFQTDSVEVTPEIIQILASIRRQLNLYYVQTIN